MKVKHEDTTCALRTEGSPKAFINAIQPANECNSWRDPQVCVCVC